MNSVIEPIVFSCELVALCPNFAGVGRFSVALSEYCFNNNDGTHIYTLLSFIHIERFGTKMECEDQSNFIVRDLIQFYTARV